MNNNTTISNSAPIYFFQNKHMNTFNWMIYIYIREVLLLLMRVLLHATLFRPYATLKGLPIYMYGSCKI